MAVYLDFNIITTLLDTIITACMVFIYYISLGHHSPGRILALQFIPIACFWNVGRNW